MVHLDGGGDEKGKAGNGTVVGNGGIGGKVAFGHAGSEGNGGSVALGTVGIGGSSGIGGKDGNGGGAAGVSRRQRLAKLMLKLANEKDTSNKNFKQPLKAAIVLNQKETISFFQI